MKKKAKKIKAVAKKKVVKKVVVSKPKKKSKVVKATKKVVTKKVKTKALKPVKTVSPKQVKKVAKPVSPPPPPPSAPPKSSKEEIVDKDLALLKRSNDLDIEVDDDVLDEELDLEIEEELKDLERITEGVDRSAKDQLIEQIFLAQEDYSLKDMIESLMNLDFFKSDTDDCLEKGCDNPSSTLGYCRFHYIKRWAEIKKKQDILSQNTLAQLFENLLKQNTIANVESILADLNDDKSFYNALKELDIDVVGQLEDDEEVEEDVEFETVGPKDIDIDEDN